MLSLKADYLLFIVPLSSMTHRLQLYEDSRIKYNVSKPACT